MSETDVKFFQQIGKPEKALASELKLRRDGGPGSGPRKKEGGDPTAKQKYKDMKDRAESASERAIASQKAEDHEEAGRAHEEAGRQWNKAMAHELSNGTAGTKAQGGHLGKAQDHFEAARILDGGVPHTNAAGWEGHAKRMNLP